MKTVKVSAELGELEHLRAVVDEVLAGTTASKEERAEIDLALEEVFVNIVKYAHLPKPGMVTVAYEHDSEQKAVIIQFQDEGSPFNPLKLKDPDVEANLSERAPGGLGIYMLKKLMDKVEYSYDEGMNRLVIWKKLSGQKGEEGDGIRNDGSIQG